MPYKKCGMCGVSNKSKINPNITIFDVSKREYANISEYDYLCEQHFTKEDFSVYADGRKR